MQNKSQWEKFSTAINQYAITSLNYYIGLVDYEPEEYKELDDKIRLVLMENKIHFKLACKERLYINRSRLGRGLHSIEMKAELMLLAFNNYIKNRVHLHSKEMVIYTNWKENLTHVKNIQVYLAKKYNVDDKEFD